MADQTCEQIRRGEVCGQVLTSTGTCRRCQSVQRASAWNKANRERRRQIVTAWDDRNREWVREKNRLWREANPTYMRDTSRSRRAENPDYDRQHPASPETRTTAELRRRALLRGNEASLTTAEWRSILAAANGRCYYCGLATPALQQEHCTPLSRGGAHSAENVVAACGRCNSRKGTMTREEYLAALGLDHG